MKPASDLVNGHLPGGHQQGEDRVALLELFCGCARLTTEYAHAGINVLEPRDLLLGHDLSSEAEQERVLQDIAHFKPELVWVALPCTVWGPWALVN